MSTYFGIATHRIIYKASSFGLGKTVTAYIWNPSLAKSALQTFTEVSDGLYYLDYAFAVSGTHFGVFYEGGVATLSGVFRIVDLVATVWDGASAITLDFGTLVERIYQMISNKMTVVEATGNVALRNIADNANIAAGNVASAAGTTTRSGLSWA